MGRRSRWCPESSLGTGWPSPGIWVFHSPCQAVLLGQLAVFPACRGSLPRAWSPSQAWRIICDFWWPPQYSSCMYNSNLTILYVSWTCILIFTRFFPSLWWKVRRSCIEFEKWISRGLISEKAMASHSSTLAWKIPWMEEPGRLQSMGSLRVRNEWATSLSLFTFMHWRRKWQPTPVFLPGEALGRGSLVGCRLWGHTESDTTEVT